MSKITIMNEKNKCELTSRNSQLLLRDGVVEAAEVIKQLTPIQPTSEQGLNDALRATPVHVFEGFPVLFGDGLAGIQGAFGACLPHEVHLRLRQKHSFTAIADHQATFPLKNTKLIEANFSIEENDLDMTLLSNLV